MKVRQVNVLISASSIMLLLATHNYLCVLLFLFLIKFIGKKGLAIWQHVFFRTDQFKSKFGCVASQFFPVHNPENILDGFNCFNSCLANGTSPVIGLYCYYQIGGLISIIFNKSKGGNWNLLNSKVGSN